MQSEENSAASLSTGPVPAPGQTFEKQTEPTSRQPGTGMHNIDKPAAVLPPLPMTGQGAILPQKHHGSTGGRDSQDISAVGTGQPSRQAGICDVCGQPFLVKDLMLVQGQNLCIGCREELQQKLMKKPEIADGARPTSRHSATGRVPASGPQAQVKKAKALLNWPAVHLNDAELDYQKLWKKNANISAPPPIKEKSYALAGSAMSLPLVPGLLLLGGGGALVFLFNGAIFKIAGAVLGLLGLWLCAKAIDGRASIRLDTKGFWKDAFISSTRVHWTVFKSVEIKEKAMPSFLGKMASTIYFEVIETNNKVHRIEIPVFLGNLQLSQHDFDALKKQLAAAAVMMGGRLK
ncbi:MAG: TraR/DksA C4-type zinc finger protein [Planctomycetes bacterium]|nr:TraR/DksA C4-type zinc finger protein [Planctomycetota bacterium]